jgi:hypothetical protein
MVSFYIYRASVVNSCQDRLQTRKTDEIALVNNCECHVVPRGLHAGTRGFVLELEGLVLPLPKPPPGRRCTDSDGLVRDCCSLCLSRACLGKLSLCIGVSTALKTQNGEHAK